MGEKKRRINWKKNDEKDRQEKENAKNKIENERVRNLLLRNPIFSFIFEEEQFLPTSSNFFLSLMSPQDKTSEIEKNICLTEKILEENIENKSRKRA